MEPSPQTASPQHRTRARRLNCLAVLLVIVAGLGVQATARPWYAFDFGTKTLRHDDYTTTGNVVGRAVRSGRQIVATPATPASNSPGAPTTPRSTMGFPIAAMSLVLMALMGAVAARIRSLMLCLAALSFAFNAWRQLMVLRTIVEDPAHGGSYLTALPGITAFTTWVMVAALVVAVITAQVGAPKVKAALAKATELAKRPIDGSAAGFAGGLLGRFSKLGEEPGTPRDAHRA